MDSPIGGNRSERLLRVDSSGSITVLRTVAIGASASLLDALANVGSLKNSGHSAWHRGRRKLPLTGPPRKLEGSGRSGLEQAFPR